MKIIIDVFGAASIGKTSSIKAAYAKLSGKDFTELQGDDIYETIHISGKLIGFASEGDPNSDQKENIKSLIDNGCDVIVCASRTKGETSRFVEEIANDNDYLLLKMSPITNIGWLEIWGDEQIVINQLIEINGESIANLINKLIPIV